MGYDNHFRRQRASKRGSILADVDSSIWTLYFEKATSKDVCEDCFEPGHKSCFTQILVAPREKGSESNKGNTGQVPTIH